MDILSDPSEVDTEIFTVAVEIIADILSDVETITTNEVS